jgi:hypothetical protein
MTVYLDENRLTFDFTEIHPAAQLHIDFQRTLRIPDDGRRYPLPPGFGRFSVHHVEDFRKQLPDGWIRRGGVVFPIQQAEAVWINFTSYGYPFAIKIASGKINAVTGEPWGFGLNRTPQDYVVSPRQRWLDGFCVGKGLVRQFVAMPLGKGYSVEEQITKEGVWGGLQIVAYPMKPEIYREREEVTICVAESPPFLHSQDILDMGLAPGGRVNQEIFEDEWLLSDWDQRSGQRCFIAMLNGDDWQRVSGEPIPGSPISAKTYSSAGLPWFDYYADRPAVAGSERLAELTGISAHAEARGDDIPEINDPVAVSRVVKLSKSERGRVRNGLF